MNGFRVVGAGLAGVVAIGLISVLGWGITHAKGDPSERLIGQPAPSLAVRNLSDGRVVNLANLRGRPVVINFWASWCVPCRQEAATLNAAATRHQGQVTFVGADFRDSLSGARAFQAEFKTPYPTGPIVAGSYQAYFVTAPPETFFLDRHGVVDLRIVGPILDAQRLDLYLSQIGA